MSNQKVKLKWSDALIRGSVIAFVTLASALFGSSSVALAQSFDRIDVEVGGGPTGMAAGPIGGDATADLAVANPLTGGVSVLLRAGDGSFTRDEVVVGGSPVDVAIGRLNRDQRGDIAVANRDGSVTTLLAERDGGFKRRDAKTKGTANGLAIGRFSGDRRTDIAVANAFKRRQKSVSVEILLGKRRARFERKQTIHFGEGDGEPSDVALGRFNDDRRNDLAISMSDDGFGGGGAEILLGKKRGRFRVNDNFGVGSGSTSVGVGRLDGDAEQDIVTTSPGGVDRLGLFNSGGVEVLLGGRGATFSRGPRYPTGEDAAPLDTAVVDLDGDGTLDLATTDVARDVVMVRAGDGEGEFSTTVDIPIGSDPMGIAAADLSGDGMPDLATANEADGTVTVLVSRSP